MSKQTDDIHWYGEKIPESVTLRDYFAAKAMQAIISSALTEGTKTQYTINKPDFLECLSLDAYAHADAMLKVREAKL